METGNPLPGLGVRSTRLLECAAISPGLRSVLLYDADTRGVELVASWLGQMLQVATRQKIECVTLRVTDDDEDLWGRHLPAPGGDTLRLQWQPGALVSTGGTGRLVVIPDLSSLSLPALRAVVALMGADAAHLEREGVSRAWRPTICWLAACAVGDLGKVSPHLLDRFALRLDLPGRTGEDRLRLLRAVVNTREVEGAPLGFERLSHQRARHLRRAAAHFPEDGGAWLSGITDYLSGSREGTGLRRAITLARLAVAEARLKLEARITTSHLDCAARLLGIPRSGSDPAGSLGTHAGPTRPERVGSAHAPGPEDATAEGGERPFSRALPGERSVVEAGVPTDEATSAEVSLLGAQPVYREDAQPPEREPGSLRPLPRPLAGIRATRGLIVGTRPAHGLFDLAVTSTLLQAAPYQSIRRRNQGGDSTDWFLLPEDLRSYRRAPVPDRLLVLILDHTVLPGLAWHDAVQPHLHWAYVERAAICVVSVGTQQDPFRAERLVVRNLLASQLASALVERPGTGTPLAHGLELARHTLRHGLQHGRGTAHDARLVLLTDGRGNVPLAAAGPGQLASAVGQAGIDDALSAARAIGQIKHLHSFVLAPVLRHYPDLPRRFATALGAVLVSVARVEGES